MAQLYKDGRPDIRGHRPNKSVMLCDDDDDDDDDHNGDDGGLALVRARLIKHLTLMAS